MIPIEGYALLDAIAIGETIVHTRYNELYGGRVFQGYDKFPEWTGVLTKFGMTHAAGRYQFQPGTWEWIARAAKLSDFSPTSQDEGAWFLAIHDYRMRAGSDLLPDLQMHRLGSLVPALKATWQSISVLTGIYYQGALVARQLIASRIALASGQV
jgi:muramidase (phage lysozyme)